MRHLRHRVVAVAMVAGLGVLAVGCADDEPTDEQTTAPADDSTQMDDSSEMTDDSTEMTDDSTEMTDDSTEMSDEGTEEATS